MNAASPLHLACPSCHAVNRLPAARLDQQPGCGRCHRPLFNGAPLTLDAGNFDAHASRSDIPLLVDFWAGWCGPCLQMAPAFAQAAAQLEPALRLGKLDTEAESALAARFAIRSIPTLVLLQRGRELARQSGAMPVTAIVQWARQHLPR
ncbi:thioredoxin TrxC [Stenotrophomonas sp. YIM B06876]|uniref:thioredoxin TrxC n=1 Tax=Stenotrophomonas sp. YIM B06876 TaxID=3060211 RepID=UPI0027392696|nr:thioredoxin TrxC [Stenotrophomonas sp. YIM B06876]